MTCVGQIRALVAQKRQTANPASTQTWKRGAIADELVKLHKAEAIKSEQDASFYANLVRLFGASFTARVGPHVPKQGARNGTVPEPGKPYAPNAAQRGKVPRVLSRKQEAKFLLAIWKRRWPTSRRRRNSARA